MLEKYEGLERNGGSCLHLKDGLKQFLTKRSRICQIILMEHRQHPSIRLIERLEAEEKLLTRGWRKKECDECKGSGIAQDDSYKFHYMWPCSFCDGVGFNWISPITK